MKRFRDIARNGVLGALLAGIVALAGLAAARLAGDHAAHSHDFAQLQSICAEHGLQAPPAGHAPDGRAHQCQDCVACSVKTIVALRSGESMLIDWPARSTSPTGYSISDHSANGSLAPPDITARGPPALI